jgi:hypothetical protein
MKDLLDKLSSYNLFNNLFPGIIFVLVTSKYTAYNYVQENLVTGIFLYYFIGLVISRIGSLFVEPILKYFSFLKFTDYKNYVKASQKDITIVTLSEVNNMYRTVCSLFIVISFLKVYEKLESIIVFLPNWRTEILITSLLLLFLFSYKKQTNYINKRVDANIQD